MKILPIAILTAYISISAAQAQERETLPKGVVPEHYDVLISPDSAALTYKGKVAVTLSVRQPTSDIVLNAVGQTFDRVTLDGNARGTARFDDALKRATLHFDHQVAAGRHVLEIEFHAPISRTTLGLFAMDYAGSDGPHRTLATNLEPAEARKVFPCWDEPGLKATFTVSVDAPETLMALSNMPVNKTQPLGGGLQRVTFAETPKMSTYLFFLGIGDFERIHKTVDGVDVGVVVKKGDMAKGAYALEEAGKLLHFYNDYFGVPYPLPKLDLIAAPGKIEGGSMENWGAIFYSQDHVLFDPARSTERDRQLVFLVVAHEMAHQWFGDLVTMSWWGDLWLNEGFARWMQTFVADALHPEWHTGLQASSIYEGGKHADAIPSTHPVVQPVLTAEQAAQAFDQITYDKGAAVIAMMNGWLGPDVFRDGLRRYMRAHAYGNTMDQDFWSALQQTAGKPIGDVARDLTRQAGVPLVKVAQTKNGIALSEGRFAENPSTIATAPTQTWHIPVAIGGHDGETRVILLDGKQEIPTSQPVLVNKGQLGYLRVVYDEASFTPLADAFQRFSPMDRLGLLNDAFMLGEAGYAPLSRALTLVKSLPVDADPFEWQRVITLLGRLDRLYDPGPAKDRFRDFVLATLKPLSDRLGTSAVPAEDGNVQTLRVALLTLRGRFGDPAMLAWARQAWTAKSGTPADLRAALGIVAGHTDRNGFEQLLKQAREEKNPLEKQHLFEGLGHVEDPAFAKILGEAIFAGDAPAGTVPALIGEIAANHPDEMLDLSLAHFHDSGSTISPVEKWHMIGEISETTRNETRLKIIEDYAAKEVPKEARRPFAGYTAMIQQNIRIAADALPELDQSIRRSAR